MHWHTKHNLVNQVVTKLYLKTGFGDPPIEKQDENSLNLMVKFSKFYTTKIMYSWNQKLTKNLIILGVQTFRFFLFALYKIRFYH
jgi:hypothetical protein